MKLIKKIAAIMFAFMMVVSMSTNVSAAETGRITISPANPNEEYKIYKILKLESYDETKQLYSYTKTGNQWDAFIDSAVTDGYLTINTDEYVTFSTTKNSPADVREFARKALAYATDKKITETSTATTGANDTSVTIDGLELGYYLVGSSMGALCSLDTTHPEVTINDKNKKPTVEKNIALNNDINNLVSNNSANIGDDVIFLTTINVQPGAKNYVLHDKMDSHLQYGGVIHVDDNLANLADTTDFVVKTNELTDGCTFEISFTEAYYKKNRDNIDSGKLTQIYVHYGATVKDDAVINEPMKNTTHLTYGDKNKESNKTETTTKTFGITVFKYTGDNKALEGAEFKLSTDSSCKDTTKDLKFKNLEGKYRYNTSGDITLISSDKGYIHIEGLKEGTYYLKETKAPKGYNLLKAPLEIKIDSAGKIYLNGSLTENAGDVRVQNKSGTVLPSTGGAGTTMIYLVGAVLVLGSGVVLATKRRVKNK